MASTAEKFELRPDELAFHFAGDEGLAIEVLFNFLRRASTIAGRNGAELRVVGLLEGSLLVKLRAIPVSKMAQNAGRKFVDDPLGEAGKVTVLVGGIAAALIWAFGQGATPIAKAGAEIVDKHQVTQISVVTNNNVTVVMNEPIAGNVRAHQELARGRSAIIRHHRAEAPATTLAEMPQLATISEDFRRGRLTGAVAPFRDAMHFQPDGFHFSVPVYMIPGLHVQLVPGARYRVGGSIEMLDGQPDRLVVEAAELIPG